MRMNGLYQPAEALKASRTQLEDHVDNDMLGILRQIIKAWNNAKGMVDTLLNIIVE